MVSREIIEIILKAQDQASSTTKKVHDKVKEFGDAAKQSNQKAAQASQQLQQKLQGTTQKINEGTKSIRKIGREGTDSFKALSKSQQDSAIKFNMLDKETQILLRDMDKLERAGIPGMSAALTDAKVKFANLDGVTKKWQGSLDYSKSKLQLLGTNTDSLKGKIQVVGNAIPTYLGTKWDGLKSKVSSFGSFIKTNLSSALSTIRSKIESLGNAFGGLGGIISSAIGGLGMASITDMTVGLAMNRDRVKSLTNAVLGAGSATDKFFGKMDELTNSSLVGLDDLAQAMSTIKMSTGMSNDQLSLMLPTVNDLGQRAIMMGKDSTEALGLMQAAGKGLNGEFNMLQDNFGISKKKLQELGWSGAATDVKGYQEALQKALDQGGDMGGMMDTTTGKLETLKKNFRIAGRHIGEKFTPYIEDALDWLNKFSDPANGNGIAEWAIGIAGLASGFAMFAPSIAPALQAMDFLGKYTKSALVFTGLLRGEEGALTLATLSNTIAEKANAVAKAAGGAAAVTAAGANAGLTASLWAMTTALLANPITWVVVALVALAVAVYNVGKSFGWWSDVGSMLEAIKNNIGRLWDAFINHPDVKAIIKGIGDAWNWLNTTLKPVVDWLKGMWDKMFPASAKGKVDGTRMIIDAIGFAFKVLVTPIKTVISALQTLYNFALPIGQGIYNALKPIVCIFMGCSPGIVPALQKVQEVFTTVWNTIAGFISGVVSNVVSAIQPLINILSLIASVYLTAFNTSWQIVVSTFNIVWNSINRIISIFNLFMSGQISLTQGLSMVWNTIKGMYISIFANIIGHVVGWASSIVNKAKEAGRGFFNGVINFIKRLPGGIGTYLLSVIGRIASAGRQWVITAKNKAQSMVTGAISYVKQLPDKIYNEFASIPGKIRDAALNAVNAAKDFGKKIMDAVLNTLGIHSPGIIQKKIKDEFKNTVSKITDNVKPAGEAAKQLGDSILDNFGTPELSVGTDDLLNEDALKTSIGVQAELVNDLDAPKVNTNLLSNGLGEVSTLTNSSNADIASSYQKLTNQMSNSLNGMVNADKLAYNSIRSNDAIVMSNISSNLTNKMNQMNNTMRTSMDNIVNKNKTSMIAAKNNTKNQLDLMLSKTKSANSKMVQSWLNMTHKIVSAANKIKTDSTSHFKKLETSIGGFYRKLQNPSGFGAGPGGHVSSRKPHGGNGFRKIKNIVRQYSLPQYLTSGEVRRNPLITNTNMGDYITPDNTRFSTADLIRAGNIKIPLNLEDIKNKGAGWLDAVPPHVRKIKETSNKWSMKGPKIIGKYQTNTGFKVSDFINGTPKIDFATFKSMAEDVFSQCHYDFYYDSNKYGSWQNAFQGGYMNCSDSSDALIAFAHACGLSASKVHGHWNNVGHFWAEVEGHKMDTTGWMNQRNWTPSASHAGPAPKSMSFEGFINELKDASSNEVIIEKDNNNNETVTVDGEFTIVHDFINLPDGVSADEVANIVSKTTADENWIKKLVQNIRFQKHDLKEKTRLKAKKSRAIGV